MVIIIQALETKCPNFNKYKKNEHAKAYTGGKG